MHYFFSQLYFPTLTPQHVKPLSKHLISLFGMFIVYYLSLLSRLHETAHGTGSSMGQVYSVHCYTDALEQCLASVGAIC